MYRPREPRLKTFYNFRPNSPLKKFFNDKGFENSPVNAQPMFTHFAALTELRYLLLDNIYNPNFPHVITPSELKGIHPYDHINLSSRELSQLLNREIIPVVTKHI